MDAIHRLVTYGTLSPGRSNHGQLSGLRGTWRQGSVRGRLVDEAWGSAFGYPAIVLDSDAVTVDVHIFESPDLPEHWARLDAWEGDGYRRTLLSVLTDEGVIEGFIYELAPRP